MEENQDRDIVVNGDADGKGNADPEIQKITKKLADTLTMCRQNITDYETNLIVYEKNIKVYATMLEASKGDANDFVLNRWNVLLLEKTDWLRRAANTDPLFGIIDGAATLLSQIAGKVGPPGSNLNDDVEGAYINNGNQLISCVKLFYIIVLS